MSNISLLSSAVFISATAILIVWLRWYQWWSRVQIQSVLLEWKSLDKFVHSAYGKFDKICPPICVPLQSATVLAADLRSIYESKFLWFFSMVYLNKMYFDTVFKVFSSTWVFQLAILFPLRLDYVWFLKLFLASNDIECWKPTELMLIFCDACRYVILCMFANVAKTVSDDSNCL